MTKHNVVRLYLLYKKLATEGNKSYKSELQGAIKTRGAMNAEELAQARPWVVPYVEEMTKAGFSNYTEYEAHKAKKAEEAKKAKEKTDGKKSA